MAEEKKGPAKPKKTSSPALGNQAKATVLDSTTKLDIDTNKTLIDNVILAGTNGGLDLGELQSLTTISNNRDQVYQLIDTMSNDSTVSSIIRTYAENVCVTADNGHIVWCESDNPNVSKHVNYLLNIMNVDKNIFKWAYSLIKYGDVYLRLYRESDYEDSLFKPDAINQAYSARNVLNESAKKDLEESVKLSVHSANDPYSYYVEMVANPGTMYELTKYGKTYGYVETPDAVLKNMFDYTNLVNGGTNNLSVNNYRMKSGDVNIYQADDFVHACLEDNYSRYPETVDLFLNNEDYSNNANAHSFTVKRGKSMLYDSYKTWREKTLLEGAILLNRITRSSMYRTIGIETGDMPKEQAQQTLRRFKELFEQKSAINKDKSFSEYNNPGPFENNIYYNTHNGQGAITIGSVGGDVNVKDLADYDDWVNKFYAAYGIPKAYFGYTDDAAGFNGGSSLSIISSVFANGVIRVQNSLIQMITDAINLFLLNRGLKSYLNNFTIKMKTPLTQDEKDFRANLTDRINAVSNFNSLFSDVEDKARKLEVVKELVKTLHYGDGLIAVLDEEIAASKAAAKKAADEAAEQDRLAKETETTDMETVEEAPTTEEPAEEADLGMSSIAPIESFAANPGTTPLVEGPDVLDNNDDLPMPNEISEDIDFSENN